MAISSNPPVKDGDRVRLRSGGPVMTAERIMHTAANPFAQCSWIDQWERPHRAFYTLAALELANPPEEKKPGPVW